MKKRFTILAAAFALLAFLAIPMGMRGQTAMFGPDNFSGQGTSGTGSAISATVDGVTFACDKGFGTTQIRCYSGSTITISSSNTITAISFTFSGSYTGGLQTSYTDLSTNSWTQTLASQARIMACSVSYTDGGTPTPTTYAVTYDCNGGTSGCPENVTGIEVGTQIQLAAAPTKTDYTFDGWSDGSTTYQAGANYTVNGNVTMTAQWTEIVSGDEQWVLTNLADLTASDVFVIVGNNGSDYAMSNDGGTTNAPSAVAVTVNGNEITSAVPSTIKWTISGNASDGYTFYPNGSTTTWLYCYNNNNGLRVGTSADKTFVVNSNYLYNVGQNRYIGIYNSQNWRCYTSINNNIQNQTFAFYKKVTGGVIPPSITAANVDIAYNATSGSIAYTINNGVTGGTMSVATESDWLTLGQGTTSPISFTCAANEGAAERTAIVTLTYTYDRATATANVTVTQAGNPNVIDNISDITATGVDYAVIGTVVAASARGFVMGDGTGYVYTYLNAIPEVAVGDIKKISGTMGSYNHVLQFTNTATIEDATNSNYNNTPAIQVLDATGIGTYSEGLHLSDYVQIEGMLSISDNYYNIAVDGLTSTASISYPTDAQKAEMTDLDNKHVIVKGYFAGVSSGHFNVLLGTIEEVVSAEPSITIVNPTVNVPVEGAEGTLTVYYENIEEMVANVYFCDAEGDAASYDWIYAEVDDDNNLYYSINPNDGEARTAYLKVYEWNTNTYSNLVTINQAAYVAPTYAELPFEFNEGRAAIEETDGLYQEGLGTDYSATTAPNTRLKFDGTGDWLLLQFNERPGTLTFNIRNNSFSGGTFKVQTSEDGVTYTDLFTYTEITETQSEEFNNLGENVRYIKWIYTEKASGNVGLGNIVLQQYVAPQEYTLSVSSLSNVELFVFDANDESQAIIEGEGSAQVLNGTTIEISASAMDGYVLQSLMVDGVEHVNDITEEQTYTFVMPNHNVTISATAVEDVPFVPATYTLVTSLDQIESGKTYIIVGKKNIDGVDSYYAMGEQRSKNRGGVAISVDGITATVETAEVHEFIIDGTAWIGPDFDFNNEDQGVDYSIYDTNEASQGYLYAASSTDNVLKTEAEPDENANWDITIDENGQFSIVAKGSNTHNVMQFNYNGGNTLFNCYTTASQLPVYLYVKEEATTATQTTNLVAGWNWFSTYVEVEDPVAMLQAVEASLGENGIQIKSSLVNTEYDSEWGWFGDLDDIGMTNEQMYAINVIAPCTVTLQGTPAITGNHTITINQGWNWIGFPSNVAISLDNAFAGFAQEGDKIKNTSAQIEYDPEWGWFGDFENLEPGQGYLYYSASSTPRTLVFNTGAKAN